MARTHCATAKRRWSACLTMGVILTATLALGTFSGSASADEHREKHWDRGHHHGWNGGYYRAPPVVYGSRYGGAYYGSPYYGGSPYYYAPPVVYGPGIGISLPFVGINIR